ncbi:DegT/DnrJ/EryC1/StrS family aminotransferase [Pseudactinotalea sp. Z1748]|uniref:DegT/DnrJ/EryC1/StrS family aminotransferase n=1 Tax=Pseudactinotalea sp. Z1748 TaxID=3413027 RepID=UPI003C7C9DA9
MSTPIFLSPPDVGRAEEDAALRALRSGWVAPLGPEVDAFEREIAEYTGRDNAVALSSGTAALHMALLNHGVKAGQVVLTSTMTFAATANAITYTGAEPVFVDSGADGNINVELLQQAMEDLRRRGATIGAILPVDLLGKVADYENIEPIAAEAGVPVISDVAESLGARRNGTPAGGFGNAAILSFNGNKVMTTSGGGMLVTDDASIAERTRYLATQARQPVRHYEHTDVGYNYRLSNVLAAIGRAQLVRLDGMIERRRQHRLAYREVFDAIPGVTVFGAPDGAEGTDSTRDNYWLTSILVQDQVAGWSSRSLMDHLAASRIEARPLWKPMHLQPVFSGAKHYTDGTSEQFFETGVSLPSGSALSEQQFDRILNVLHDHLHTYR